MIPRGVARFRALPGPLRQVILATVHQRQYQQQQLLILLLSGRAAHHARVLSTSTSTSSTTSTTKSIRRTDPKPSPPRSLSFLPPPTPLPPSPTTTTDESTAATTTSTILPVAVPGREPPSFLLDKATNFFHNPKFRTGFLYSVQHFRDLPINTRIPEVCLIGRSNVGKSTLLNALAGAEAGMAGRTHGGLARRQGLAKVSAKAGCTRTMVGYGFGPPMRLPASPKLASEAAAAGDEGGGGGGSNKRLSRSERRRGDKVVREPPPRSSLVVLDLPGYGHNSELSWGQEIEKYLDRRVMMRGAILLVDAVAGLKDADRDAIRLLRRLDVPTLVVLTKADKLANGKGGGGGGGGAGEEEAEDKIRDACRRVWRELGRVGEGSGWRGGRGWEPEIHVTGAGDPAAGELGVAGARLAICRLAGVFEPTAAAAAAAAKSKPVTVVPFDELQYASTSTPVAISQDLERRIVAEEAERRNASAQLRTERVQGFLRRRRSGPLLRRTRMRTSTSARSTSEDRLDHLAPRPSRADQRASF